jgi:methyl acetate hydrolase
MSLKSTIDQILSQACAAGDVPGVIAMATDRNGMVYEGAFGVRALGQPQPQAMTLDTVVWIASMTKAITGAAAMQLVEQGKLDLDTPAGQLLPELAQVQVLEGFGSGGKPILRAPKTPVTLRNLLTHTAGYGYDMWNPEIGRYQEVTGLQPLSSGKYAALKAPLLFDPGTRWNKSSATTCVIICLPRWAWPTRPSS